MIAAYCYTVHTEWRGQSVCLYVGHVRELSENGWTDRDAVLRPIHVRPRNHLWGQVWTNRFAAARGDKTAMLPFVKILWPVVNFIASSATRRASAATTSLPFSAAVCRRYLSKSINRDRVITLYPIPLSTGTCCNSACGKTVGNRWQKHPYITSIYTATLNGDSGVNGQRCRK